ncbi:MAG: hypothetical protein IPN90_03090 [Elusimicrobia bacterium]|nr:hypothetical protein [Elusimicrobiota bacterium]
MVSLGTPGGPATARYAFVVPMESGGNRETWGEAGTVAWTEPQTLRHMKPQLRVAGLVARPNTQTVDVLVLTTEDISALDPHSESTGARLTFDQVDIKGGRFETTVHLSPGANILLARPGPQAASRADTGLRTVFFEPQGSRISLEEPLLAQGRLFLRGSSKGQPVQIEVSAWVRGPSNTPIRKEKIWETTLSTDTNGNFETNVALKDIPVAPQVQGFPEVSAMTGKDKAIRVVVDWKNQK